MVEQEGLPELFYDPIWTDGLGRDADAWVGPDGVLRIAVSSAVLREAAVNGVLVPIVRESLRTVGQGASERADSTHRFLTQYQFYEKELGDREPGVLLDHTRALAGDRAVLYGDTAAAHLAHAISLARRSGDLESLNDDPSLLGSVSASLGWAAHDARQALESAREQSTVNAGAINVLLEVEDAEAVYYDPSLPRGVPVDSPR